MKRSHLRSIHVSTKTDWFFRALIVSAIFFLSMEAVARMAPLIVGKYVHQPFLYSVRECKFDFINKGKLLSWLSNERGARGELFRGQRLQIAVFGTSTSAGTSLDQKETWPERLKQYLGPANVQMDNYARDGAGVDEAEAIMGDLTKSGVHYDMALLMLYFHEKAKKPKDVDAFDYSNQWRLSPDFFKSPHLIKKRLIKQIYMEPRLKRIYLLYRKTKDSSQKPPSGVHHPPPFAMSNRALRNKGKVKLMNVPVEFSETQILNYKKRVKHLLTFAQGISNNIILITQPVAYDESEHPGVSKRWYTLYPVPGMEGFYESNRSIAQSIRARNSFAVGEAKSLGVRVIDLDNFMRPMLHNRTDLFEDKWHLGPAGARVAADFIGRNLRSDFPAWFPTDETIKNKIQVGADS